MFMCLAFTYDVIRNFEFENVAILVDIVVNEGGYGEVLRCYQKHEEGQD